MRISTTALSTALALVLLAAGASAQTTWYVSTTGTPPGTGTALDPYTSIQYAIDQGSTVSGDTILVAPGTYVEEVSTVVSGVGAKAVTIRSSGGPAVTVLREDPTFAVVNLSVGAELDGFTVTSDSPGSGVGVANNQAVVRNCLIHGLQTGLYTVLPPATVHRTTITGCARGIDDFSILAYLDMHDSIVLGNSTNYWGSGPANGAVIEYSAINPLEAGVGNVAGPAKFWFPADGDWNLKPGSPCIDAGDPAAALDPDGSRADMGAFPYSPTHAPEGPRTYCTSKVNSLGCTPFIDATGSASASGGAFLVECYDVLNGKSGLLFYGYANKAVPYQAGHLCVRAPVRRTSLQNSGGNPPPDDCSGVYSYDFEALILSGADPMLTVGAPVFAQYWYRDPADTSGFTTGRSDALGFTVMP